MTQNLAVWNDGIKVGALSIKQGRWQFAYDSSWINNTNAFRLSPHFPFQTEAFKDSSNNKSVEWFFENLLPEGGMREALARKAALATEDSFGILMRYGEESAGALTLLTINQPYPEHNNYTELSDKDLQSLVTKAASEPLLLLNENLHMSLAGVQNKLGIVFKNNIISLPHGAAASTHILKPDNDNTAFKFFPANEYFCMQLAHALLLPVAKTTLLHVPQALYLTERFDREITAQGIKRKHQVDLCQLLNKWVGYKYESHGGVTTSNLFKTLEQTSQPAIAKDQVIRWIIFNYLIGNNDAHAKNISFLVDAKSIKVAPFYDLLCVQAYLPESTMAMSINKENRPGWIEQHHWEQLAAESGVAKTIIKDYLIKMSNDIESAALTVLSKTEFTNGETDFTKKEIIPVIQQRVGFIHEMLN